MPDSTLPPPSHIGVRGERVEPPPELRAVPGQHWIKVRGMRVAMEWNEVARCWHWVRPYLPDEAHAAGWRYDRPVAEGE